jgi:hypothetical protein
MELSEKPEPKENKFSLQKLFSSETVLLFLLTGIGYLGVYLRKVGYFAYFGIPMKFFNLSNTELLVLFLTFFVVIGILSSTFIYFDTVSMLTGRSLLSWISQSEYNVVIVICLMDVIWGLIYWGIWDRFQIVVDALIGTTLFGIYLVVVDKIILGRHWKFFVRKAVDFIQTHPDVVSKTKKPYNIIFYTTAIGFWLVEW